MCQENFEYECNWLLTNKYGPDNDLIQSDVPISSKDDLSDSSTNSFGSVPSPSFPIIPHNKRKHRGKSSYTTPRVSMRCAVKVESAGDQYRDLLDKALNAERVLRLLNAQKRIYKNLPKLIPELMTDLIPDFIPDLIPDLIHIPI